MNRSEVFTFSTYKDYLLDHEEKRERGFRALLAKSIKCQPAYISQVLNGDSHFSPEQAESINMLLGHDDAEAAYFLLLVQCERAATTALQKRLTRQLNQLRDEQKRLKNRVKAQSLGDEGRSIYYSSWKYGAVHAAASIPKLDSPAKIAKSLGLSEPEVASIIKFLQRVGILVEDGKGLRIGKMRLHLEDDSPFILNHHSQWRFKAMESLSRSHDSDYDRRLHYSSVVSLSAKDAETIRAILQQNILGIKAKIAPSKEELVYGYNVDFFPLENGA